MKRTFVYVLYSNQLDKFYIGSTQMEPEERKDRHVTAYYGNSKFTSKASDWELFYELECSNRSQAIQIEKHIKKMKSSIYIKNLIKYPEIGKKLLIKYL